MEILSYIEIFTESFLELNSYILESSREISPQGKVKRGTSSFDNEMGPYRNISKADVIIQRRIELKRKEREENFFSLTISVLGNDSSRKLKDHSNFLLFPVHYLELYFNLSCKQSNGNMIFIFMVGDGIS